MLYVTQSCSWMEVSQPTGFLWSSETIHTVWQDPRRGHHRAPVQIVRFRAARVGGSFCSRKIDEAEETVVWRWIQKTAAAIEITRTVVSSNQASSRSTPVGSVGEGIGSSEWKKIPTGYNKEFHTFESTKDIVENFLTIIWDLIQPELCQLATLHLRTWLTTSSIRQKLFGTRLLPRLLPQQD